MENEFEVNKYMVIPAGISIHLILFAFWLFYEDKKVLMTSRNLILRGVFMFLTLCAFFGCLALFYTVVKRAGREQTVDSKGSEKIIAEMLGLLEKMKTQATGANLDRLDLQKLIKTQSETFFKTVDEKMRKFEEPLSGNITKIIAVLTNANLTHNFVETVRVTCLEQPTGANLPQTGAQFKNMIETLKTSYNSLQVLINKAKTEWNTWTVPEKNGVGTPQTDVAAYLTRIPPLLEKFHQAIKNAEISITLANKDEFNKRQSHSDLPIYISGGALFICIVIMCTTMNHNYKQDAASQQADIVIGGGYVLIVVLAAFCATAIFLVVFDLYDFTPECPDTAALRAKEFEYQFQPMEANKTDGSDVLTKCIYPRRMYTMMEVYIPTEKVVEKLKAYENLLNPAVFPIVSEHLIDEMVGLEIGASNQMLIELQQTMKPECRKEMSRLLPDFVPFVLAIKDFNDWLKDVEGAQEYLMQLTSTKSFDEVRNLYEDAVRNLNNAIDPTGLRCSQILGVFTEGGCRQTDNERRSDLELNCLAIISQCIIILVTWIVSNNFQFFIEEDCCLSDPKPPESPVTTPDTAATTTTTTTITTPTTGSKTPVTGSKMPATGSKAHQVQTPVTASKATPTTTPVTGSKTPVTGSKVTPTTTPTGTKTPITGSKTPESKITGSRAPKTK